MMYPYYKNIIFTTRNLLKVKIQFIFQKDFFVSKIYFNFKICLFFYFQETILYINYILYNEKYALVFEFSVRKVLNSNAQIEEIKFVGALKIDFKKKIV